MSDSSRHLDKLLSSWRFTQDTVQARETTGSDGRELLLLRIDMGALLMETTGRPDGFRPGGCDTYYDLLVAEAFREGESFLLDDQRCREIDREFFQFYHRRIALLSLKRYAEALRDAEHTLRLMDFSSANSPDEDWTRMHEQYRPLVMFHRVQAAALVALEDARPREALRIIDEGSRLIRTPDSEDDPQPFDGEEFREKLEEMRSAITEHYDLTPSLTEQLAEAIASEQYERAAKLRDRIRHGGGAS